MRYLILIAASCMLLACGGESAKEAATEVRESGKDVVDTATNAMQEAENVEKMLEDRKQEIDAATGGRADTDDN